MQSPQAHDSTFETVVNLLESNNIPLESFIRRVLIEPGVADRLYISEFIKSLPLLLQHLAGNPQTCRTVSNWIKGTYVKILKSQVCELTKPKNGFHFVASSITAERMKECSIKRIEEGIMKHAPELWELVGELLQADPGLSERRRIDREKREKERAAKDVNGRKQVPRMSNNVEEYEELDGMLNDKEDEPEDIEDQLENQLNTLIHVKQITCISIIMQATNQKANMLQALVGVFLQSCNVADQARQFLAHIGISVSAKTIDRAIDHLSKEASHEMKKLGATLLTAYAYDNLDVDLPHSRPTEEQSMTDTLVHLTTASMFPLNHGITKDDLAFSDTLRELALNPPLPATTKQLMAALPSNQRDDKNLTYRDRFNRWKFINDLVQHGPPAFAEFKNQLGLPEDIECIPVTKTKQVPLRASETGPNTPAKNAAVMQEFFRQSNIGETDEADIDSGSENESPGDKTVNPTKHVTQVPVDIGNHVLLVFGDLGTGKYIQSLQASRIVDVTPFQRFQSVIYCPGWFHVRMACADAIWRRHIAAGPNAEEVPTALINYVGQIRPLERRKIETNPGFRQMHEIILHAGIVHRLEAWREAIQRRYGFLSLSKWAESKPRWEDICEVADTLIKEYVAPASMFREFQKDDSERDKVFELARVLNKDFLLYEETTYAMNHGDIGRLDRCLPTWMYFYMGCGKVKYAGEIRQYLEKMYIVYPKPLAHAIRFNSLVNPTGKPDHFRAVDWVIEHNNLYIKRIFGGTGSNHTVHRMLEASPLIEVYKDVRSQFELMFCLSHKATRHSPPKMKITFEKLRRYMEKHQANSFIPGRGAEYEIANTMEIGMVKLTASVEEQRKAQILKAKRQESMRVQADEHCMPRAGSPSESDIVDERHTETTEDARENQEPEPNEEDHDISDDGTLFVDD